MARAILGPRTAALGGFLCLLALALPASGQDSAPRRFIVRYRAEVSAQRQHALAGRFGLRERKRLAARRLSVIEVPSPADAVSALATLRAQPEVEYAVPDVRMQMTATPNDPGFGSQWWLANTADTDIDAPQGWDVLHDAPTVVVAVVDSGIDEQHEDLAANLWTNPGEVRNGLDDDGNGYVDDVHGIDCVDGVGDPLDDNGHGTHVAGTIAAVGNNGIGVTGVAWRAQIMALKALDANGSGWYSDAIECIDYALVMKSRGVNVRVLNTSWGSSVFDQTLQDAFKNAGDMGILAVAAAGNDGLNHAKNPFYPASFPLASLLAVAATTDTGALASFSDYGEDVEIAAPGVFILSTLPGDQYGYLSGTSMASPQVAGAAALIAGLEPATSVSALRDRLLSSADRTASLQGKVQSGRLNLGAALRGAATVPLASALPVAGKKLSIADVTGAAKSKFTLSAKDFSIGPPVQGGASDPTLHGGELVVRNPESGEVLQVPLEAAGWRFAKKSYQYKGASGCKVVLRAGALSAKCVGPAARFPLETPAQGELAVDLVLGPARICTDFGGTVAKDFGIGFGPKPTKGAYAATAAPAPPVCTPD
jgi:subtilisin family serine protease